MPRPLPPGAAVSSEEQAWLDAAANAARAGDLAASENLWTALKPRFDRWARRSFYRWGGTRGPRYADTFWLLPDLEQEGFIVFAGVVASWRGETGFFPYVLASAPLRIAEAWRQMRERMPMLPPGEMSLSLLADGSAAADEAIALVAALAAGMNPVDGALLQACVAEGLSMAAAGRRVGLGRRETQRRWTIIRARLRASGLGA